MGCSHYYTCRKCEKTVSASLVDVAGRSSKVMAIKCNDYGSENVIKWDNSCPKHGDLMSDDGIAL